MQSHSDQDLVILVSLGGWIRGTQVVSASILQNYDERSAKLLRQPALVSFMQSKVNDVSSDLRNEPLVKTVSEQLGGMQKLVSFPAAKESQAYRRLAAQLRFACRGKDRYLRDRSRIARRCERTGTKEWM